MLLRGPLLALAFQLARRLPPQMHHVQGDLLEKQLLQDGALVDERIVVPLAQEENLEAQRIGAQPFRQFADENVKQPQQQDAALIGQLEVLEARLDEVGGQGENEGAPAAQELVLVAGVIQQLVHQEERVEQVGLQVAVGLHVGELREQHALDAAAVGQRREAAHRIGVLVEDARGHLHSSGQRLDLVLGQCGLQAARRAEHLAMSEALAQLFQGGLALEVEDVFRPENLGGAPRGLDQRLVQHRQQRVRPVLPERLPAFGEQLLGRRFQQGVDDAQAQLDAVEARALAELVEEVGQPAGLIAALGVTAQGVAGAGKRPVGVDLAEYVVLVGADDVDGQVGDVNPLPAGSAFPVLAERRRVRGRPRSQAAARAVLPRPPPWPRTGWGGPSRPWAAALRCHHSPWTSSRRASNESRMMCVFMMVQSFLGLLSGGNDHLVRLPPFPFYQTRASLSEPRRPDSRCNRSSCKFRQRRRPKEYCAGSAPAH